VKRNGEAIHLTPKEFELLHFLMSHAGLPLTHARILGAVWGPEYGGELETFVPLSGNCERSWAMKPPRRNTLLPMPRLVNRSRRRPIAAGGERDHHPQPCEIFMAFLMNIVSH